jgi:hypothetical protein
MICQCCGNDVQASSGITMYWLLGKRYVWSVCYECWNKPFLKALFLNSKGDLTNDLIKKFGLSLGYTKLERKRRRG